MAYFPQRANTAELEDCVFTELLRISAELHAVTLPQILLAVQTAPPEKPRDGMVAHADGVHWNPGGGGKGLYLFSTNTWVKL